VTERLPSWDSADASALRPFAHTRLVAMDLDGTLVAGDVPRIYVQIANLRRALAHPRYGVAMMIATGRTYTGARTLIDGLALPAGTPIVLYNGSVVVSPRSGHAIMRREIPRDSVSAIFAACEAARVCCLAYFFAPEALGDDPEHVIGRMSTPPYERDSNGMLVAWNVDPPADYGPSAVLIDVRTNSRPAGELARQLRRIDGVSATSSGSRYIEVRPTGSNKGAAVSVVAEMLTIAREHVVALGDNDNDVEMLEWAGIGVAVSSASEGALAAADFQCGHGVAQGAVELLRVIREAKRYFTRYRRR